RLPSVSQWTHRELNPDLQHAELVSSRWTMSPGSVDRRGLEPRFPPREGGVVPLDQQPYSVETEGIEPSQLACKANSRPSGHASPFTRGPPGGRTRTSSLPRRRASVTLADPSESQISDCKLQIGRDSANLQSQICNLKFSDPGWTRTIVSAM